MPRRRKSNNGLQKKSQDQVWFRVESSPYSKPYLSIWNTAVGRACTGWYSTYAKRDGGTDAGDPGPQRTTCQPSPSRTAKQRMAAFSDPKAKDPPRGVGHPIILGGSFFRWCLTVGVGGSSIFPVFLLQLYFGWVPDFWGFKSVG